MSPTARGKKLFSFVLDLQLMLLYLLPDGKREEMWREGWSGTMMLEVALLMQRCWHSSIRQGSGVPVLLGSS